MSIYTELKELIFAPSVSGRERKIRDILTKKIASYTDTVTTDTLGNLIALKKGKSSKKRIMLCAHMDEIGFFVNFIDDKGRIRVAPIGGINLPASIYSKAVSESGTVGILVPDSGTKPDKLKSDSVYIDIGATSRAQAEKHVKIGDFFVLEPSLYRLCGKRVCGRPLDDRVGCLVLLETARRLSSVSLEYDTYFVFSVQEEVGCRGSMPASFGIDPTDTLCVDVTLTGDTPGAKPMAVSLGGGAAIKIKDSSVICHPEAVELLQGLAEANGIKYQNEILLAGGTDTSSMQLSGSGSRACAVSVPTRHVHTAVECCDLRDVDACIKLSEKYVLKLQIENKEA